MIVMVLAVVVIFALTYFAYQYITSLDVEKLENIFEKKIPVIAGCVGVTLIVVIFIIVNF